MITLKTAPRFIEKTWDFGSLSFSDMAGPSRRIAEKRKCSSWHPKATAAFTTAALKEEYGCRLLKWRFIESGLEQLQEMKNMAEQEERQ